MGGFFSKPIPPKQEQRPAPSIEKAYFITHSDCVVRIAQMMMLQKLHPGMRSFHLYNAHCNGIAIIFYQSRHPNAATFEEIKQLAEQQNHHLKQLHAGCSSATM